eukprot:4411801-Pyramimonas_sp.AAC.1
MVCPITAHADAPNGPHQAVSLALRGCWQRPMVRTQRVPKASGLEYVADDMARGRRDQLIELLARPPSDTETDGPIEEWFAQAGLALQALQGMPEDAARYFKGRAMGIRTIAAPLEAKMHAGRLDKASPITQRWLSL